MTSGNPAITTRLTTEYGLRHPVVGAGMGFIAHEALAAAVTNSGGLGVLGASPDPVESLVVTVERLRQLTSGAFGVDLICAELGLGPASTEAHVDACIQLNVPIVVFHHDPPPIDWVRTLRRANVPVCMQVSSIELAAAAIDLGVDGLIAQGSDGVGVAAALTAGADGVWVGTALVAAVEANAHPAYQMRLVASDGETLRTHAFGPEWPDQAYPLLAALTVQAADEPAALDSVTADHVIGHTRLFPHSAGLPYDIPWHSALPPTPDAVGELDQMVYPAGQGVGAVRSVAPASVIIDTMMDQAHAILAG